MAFRANSFKFLWKKENSKSPTMPLRIVACTFPDNLSRNSCIWDTLNIQPKIGPYNSFWPCCTSKANRDFTTQTKFTKIIVVVSVGILVIFIYYFTSYTHHHLMQNAQLLYSNIFLINSPLSKTPGKSLSSSIALVPVHWHLQRSYLSKHNTAGGWQGSVFFALWSYHERFFAALDKGSQPIL